MLDIQLEFAHLLSQVRVVAQSFAASEIAGLPWLFEDRPRSVFWIDDTCFCGKNMIVEG